MRGFLGRTKGYKKWGWVGVLLWALPWSCGRCYGAQVPLPEVSLGKTYKQADRIVVMQVTGTEDIKDPDSSFTVRVVRFSITETLKGDPSLKTFTYSYGPRTDDLLRPILLSRRPILIFMSRTQRISGAIALAGPNQDLLPKFKQYISIKQNRNQKAQRLALKRFALENLQDPDGSAAKLTAAEELFALVKQEPACLDADSLEKVFKAAMASSRASVTEPLCRVLDVAGSPKTVAACLHSILATDALARSGTRLASQIRRHDALFQGLLDDAKRTDDLRRFRFIVAVMQGGPPEKWDAARVELWRIRPDARRKLRSFMPFRMGGTKMIDQYVSARATANPKERAAALKKFAEELLANDTRERIRQQAEGLLRELKKPTPSATNKSEHPGAPTNAPPATKPPGKEKSVPPRVSRANSRHLVLATGLAGLFLGFALAALIFRRRRSI
ncbi:MAG: hypothetical protein E3J64_04545 [Anaerolineales bacterium]|nr:MAG: hypothetical protein E3J64_04545 [Anaerolineales bacterium]